MEFDGLP